MMGCASNPHVHTPAIDSLAAGGVRFQRAYCSNPVCVPSRFSLMTGRMPSEIGLREQLIDLQADPFETRNAADDADKQAVLATHRQLI